MDRTSPRSVSFEQFASERLNRDREQITRDWVEELSSQLAVRPRRVLPTEELLDSVPPEMHGRIFERFFRAHPDAAEGTGLGLSIVREAIQQMESTLEFDSEPGQGTTFCFSLPRPEGEQEDA